jgi:hypothetical protein
MKHLLKKAGSRTLLLTALAPVAIALLAFGSAALVGAWAQKPGAKPAPAAQPTLPAQPASPVQDAGRPVTYRKITWDDLVPKDWDPMKQFSDADIGAMQDGDPRATKLLQRMQDAWNNAPTNAALENQPVRIPGYVVPLDTSKAGMREFLLVPYFGACIHVPPPPANQIVDVHLREPDKNIEMMDAVWVTGRMRTQRSSTNMGTSGYVLEGVAVEKYVELPAK